MIVPVPAVEPMVAMHRRRLDAAASWGVPAHVTVLYPFVHPDALDQALLDRLGQVVRSVQRFDCVFRRCEWFADDVVWLAPQPDRPFRELTSAVWRAFPEYPPYGGAFDDVVPHLTVGERRRGTPAELQAAAAAVHPHLPIATTIERAALIAGTTEPASWHTVCELPLAQPSA